MSNPLEAAAGAGSGIIHELPETGAQFDSTPHAEAARAEARLADLRLAAADEPSVVVAARRGQVAVVKLFIANDPVHVRRCGAVALRVAREHGRSLCSDLLERFLESE